MKQVVAGLALAACCVAANAYEVTFTGRITYTNASLNGVTVGSLIQGQFLGENPQGTPYFGKFPNLVDYSFSEAHLSASVEGHTMVSSAAGITVFDNFGGNIEDQFKINGGGVIAIDGVSHPGATLSFALGSQHGSTNALLSAHLPTSIDLAAFDKPYWNQGSLLLNGAPGGTVLSFDILSVKVAAVPEPDAAWLLLVGALTLATSRRRRTSMAAGRQA